MTAFNGELGYSEERPDNPGGIVYRGMGGGFETFGSADGQAAPFETVSFLPDKVEPAPDNASFKATERVITPEDCKAAIRTIQDALVDVINQHDVNFYDRVQQELPLTSTDVGYQIAELECTISMADEPHAAALAALRDQYAGELARAVELEEAQVAQLNRESEQCRADLFAKADWAAILNASHDYLQSGLKTPSPQPANEYTELFITFTALSPHTDMPPGAYSATRLRNALRSTRDSMYANDHLLPEGTVWQLPDVDADWVPTPEFGKKAMSWKWDIEMVSSLVAVPRKDFLSESPDFHTVGEMARTAQSTGMGAHPSGDDGLPLQLKYEVERRYKRAKEQFIAKDTDFIEQHARADRADLAGLQVHDPHNLARHLAIEQPQTWARTELGKLPERMTQGIRSVKFAAMSDAVTWHYKGIEQRAGADYNETEQSLTLYVEPDWYTKLMAEPDMTPLRAYSHMLKSNADLIIHEAMHHVHTWHTTFDELVQFMHRARQDDPVRVSDYVAEAYTPGTGLDGNKERFADTGVLFYTDLRGLRNIGGGHHYEAFAAIDRSFTSGSSGDSPG